MDTIKAALMNSSQTDYQTLIEQDRAHLWHPYSAMGSKAPVYPVVSASGVILTLADGRELIDGMSSWWCAIHGYNHPQLNAAIESQLADMAHVMFGGLTHPPAIALANKLVALTPAPLQTVFFSDSGSVSVDVAMKMAIQYWYARQQSSKRRFVTLRHGYHGDTFGAMSVCDPATGMHSLFSGVLMQQLFVDAPGCRFGESADEKSLNMLEQTLQQHNDEVAALILEPVVQATGGMRFYSAEYLQRARALCDEYNVLLIIDEIATGFGRTGRLFACEHADVTPDIMCLGKTLTGGYLTLAATLTTTKISTTISQAEPGVFMHGPTFMANPLACRVALASIELLLSTNWQAGIAVIEQDLQTGLQPCAQYPGVADVRVLGAIGVVELKAVVDVQRITRLCVDKGVWLRPFGKLVYLMPPYIIGKQALARLTAAVCEVIADDGC